MSNAKNIFLLLSIIIIICKCEDINDILIDKIDRSGKMKTMVVVGAASESILESCRKLKDMNIIDSILVGSSEEIYKNAENAEVNITDFELIDIKDESEMVSSSLKLIREKKADIYFKGTVDVKLILKSILDKQLGLRTSKQITGVSVFYNPEQKKFLLLSDALIKPYPTLEEKISILNDAVDVAHSLGIQNPKVAPIAAVEIANAKMQETLDARELTNMNNEGKIKDCIVDGPLSFDLAIDAEACRVKNIGIRKIKGDADVLIFPDINTANISYKILSHIVGWNGGNVITGTSAPVIIPSNVENIEDKIASVMLSIIYSQYLSYKK